MPDIKQLRVKVGWNHDAVTAGLKQLNSDVRNAQTQVKANYGALTDSLGSIGKAATVGVTLPLVALGGMAISAATKMDSLERGLVAVSGSSEKAKQQMEQLREVAKLPGLGLAEAVEGSIKLQAVGESAAEAERNMKAFGNAIATIGGGKTELAGVITQLMQMESKGKVMMEDIRIIQNYVPHITQAMKAAFGTANAEELGQMGIGAKEFIAGVVTELEKLPKVTSGLKVSLENLGDDWFTAMSNLGKAAVPAVTQVAEVATQLLGWFSKLPPSSQELALKLGLVAAAAGPVLTAFNGTVTVLATLKGGYTYLATAIATKRAATIADATATGAANVKKGVEVLLNDQLFKSAVKAATAETGLATAETAAGNAAAGAATKIGALARAQALLSKVGFLANPLIAIPAAVGAALGAGIVYQHHQRQKYLDEIDADNAAVLVRLKESYSKMSAAELKLQLDAATHGRDQLNARLKEIRGRSGHETWTNRDTFKGGTERADTEADLLTQYNFDNRRVLMLKDLLEKRVAHETEATARRRELSEKQKDALAHIEDLNRTGKQERYILAAATETEREKREEWVRYQNDRTKILDAQTKASALLGRSVDVTEALKATDEAHAAKLKEINAKAAETAAAQQASTTFAELNLQALRTTNQYEAERLQVQAQLVQTKAQLAQSKASELEYTLATEEAQKRINDITKRERDAGERKAIDAYLTRELADAVKTGDKWKQQSVEALKAFTADYAAAMAEGGVLGEAQAVLAQNNLLAAKKRIDKGVADEAKEAAKTAAENLKKQRDIWTDTAKAIGSSWESYGELIGDTQLGKRQRLEWEYFADKENLKAAWEDAQTPEEKGLISAQEYDRDLKYRKDLMDNAVGGMDTFMDKTREWKDEQIRAWDDSTKAMMRHYDAVRKEMGAVMTADQVWERHWAAGMAMSIPSPVLPERPSETITSQDIQQFWPEFLAGQERQTEELRQLREALMTLANGGSMVGP